MIALQLGCPVLLPDTSAMFQLIKKSTTLGDIHAKMELDGDYEKNIEVIQKCIINGIQEVEDRGLRWAVFLYNSIKKFASKSQSEQHLTNIITGD